MAASATFALKAGVWFRRGRLVIVSPDSRATACPLSGRNSTYRPVQISETSSDKTFGNARLARNMFEAAMSNQASRIVSLTNISDAALATIEPEDILVEGVSPS